MCVCVCVHKKKKSFIFVYFVLKSGLTLYGTTVQLDLSLVMGLFLEKHESHHQCC